MLDDNAPCNPNAYLTFDAICEQRRVLLKGAAAGSAIAFVGLPLAGCSGMPPAMATGGKPASPTFKSIPVSTSDAVVVPEGYEAYVLYAWGDPTSDGPAFKQDASNSAAEQERQAGMHHDAIHYFPMVGSLAAFQWDIFAQCGDPANADAAKRGNCVGEAYGSPDGLWVDSRGLLWIQTDVSTSVLHKGDYANLGNNVMMAANVETGETRRFLVGPNGCEVTGITTTPDMRTMFIDIQHPGETPSERSDPAAPKAVSSWPDGSAGGRPRSATVVIRRIDGGVVGT